jgi:hypothetical protein
MSDTAPDVPQRRPVSDRFQCREFGVYDARRGRQLLFGRCIAAERNLACAPVSLEGLRQIAAWHNLFQAEALRFGIFYFGVQSAVEIDQKRRQRRQKQEADQSDLKPEAKPAHDRHGRTEDDF